MDVFTALTDPVHRRIVLLLVGGAMTAGELAQACDHTSRPAVSRHLRVLREAGLVTAESTGRDRHYALGTTALRGVDSRLAAARDQRWQQRLDAFETGVHRIRRERRTTTRITDTRPTRSTG